MGEYTILEGRVEEILPSLFAEGDFDACLCDPPYLLEFMGKEFDRQHKRMEGKNDGQKMQAWHEQWAWDVLRVLKPGAHMLAFGGTRTYHRLASAMEDVGFEIRDMLSWMHGQGFPKNKDTQLKPAVEPCVLVKKPGSGKLNIDGCRIGSHSYTQEEWTKKGMSRPTKNTYGRHRGSDTPVPSGRWPANLILSHHPDCEHLGERRVKANQTSKPGSGAGYAATENHGIYGKGKGGVAKAPTADADGMETIETWDCHPDCPVRLLDEQSGPNCGAMTPAKSSKGSKAFKNTIGDLGGEISSTHHDLGRSGGASRFFYCAKVSPRERHLGGIDCRHPTLKPLSLCTYLATILLPPPSSSPRRILIPFSGAGSEIIGALRAGWDEVYGIEQEEEYNMWAEARISAALEK